MPTFDPAACDCGTPAGFHTSDCAGHAPRSVTEPATNVPPFEEQEPCPTTGAPHDDYAARVGVMFAWQCQTCGRVEVTDRNLLS
jgi:hypothetical protein